MFHRVLGWVIIILCLAAPVSAQGERVLDFYSTCIVNPDSSLLVTESITVQATGHEIKRGIVREFPTRYSTPDGIMRVGFTLVDVRRDNQPEPYHLEQLDNGVAIYMGDKNVLLKPGSYTYELTYKTTRQLGFFADHDELYWNVNGNGWRLPLDRVGCTVILPAGAQVRAAVAYEGFQGSTEQRTFPGGDNSIKIASSRPYAPGEGLTIAVSWPKGFVTEPTPTEQFFEQMSGARSLWTAIIGLILLLIYYILSWAKVGRDPAKGVIVPRFAPPKDFSPAMVRMLWRMGFDNTAFTAGIINMAVKKSLKITDNKTTQLELSDHGLPTLSPGERAAWDVLRLSGTSIALKNENHRAISGARLAMRRKLRTELASTYFKTNSAWVAPGVILTLATLGILASGGLQISMVFFLAIWLTGWTFGCFTLLYQMVQSWRSQGASSKVTAILQTLFAIPFVAGEIIGLVILAWQIGVAQAAIFLLMIGINIAFFEWLKAPTLIGRQVLDEIEGFRLYLSVAEKNRLNFIHPPEDTPQLFEKFLPYALALGVENQWAERFAAILDQAHYEPQWYNGKRWNPMRPGAFATGLGRGLTSTISSASTAPGRSSGMSGGSSGGGGGGGGGGGW